MEEARKLDKLCGVYQELNDDEKGKIIRLAEGLLDRQDFLNDEIEELWTVQASRSFF